MFFVAAILACVLASDEFELTEAELIKIPPVVQVLTMPENANPAGNVSGGWIMSQMDAAAGIVAGQRARSRVVTVAVSELVFKKPVHVGDLLIVTAKIVREGERSMTMTVEAFAKRKRYEKAVKVAIGAFVFAAVDENGEVVPLPVKE